MGKTINKFLSIMKLGDDEEQDSYYDDDYENELEEEYVKETPKKFGSKKKEKEYSYDDEPVVEQEKPKFVKNNSKVVPMRQPERRGMEVCVIKPTTVEDAREISDTLNSGRAVILNLEGLQMDVAQRIIDFTSGACYSTGGNLQKISQYIFISTPSSVDVSGDFQAFLPGDLDIN